MYYRDKTNYITLNAIILKKKLGKYYTKYIEYLIEHDVIQKIKNHRAGKNSRVYRLTDTLINGNSIKRIKNYSISTVLIDSKFISQDATSNTIKKAF